MRRAMLFPKAILQAEFAANAPMRERMAINRERLRAKRAAAKRRQKRGRPLEGTAPKETCHEGEISPNEEFHRWQLNRSAHAGQVFDLGSSDPADHHGRRSNLADACRLGGL